MTISRLPGGEFVVGRFNAAMRDGERVLPVVLTEMEGGGIGNSDGPRRISWVRAHGTLESDSNNAGSGSGAGGRLRRMVRGMVSFMRRVRPSRGSNSSATNPLGSEEDEARRSRSSGGRSVLNVEELRSVFDYINANSDGKISGPDLQSFVSLLGGALEVEEIVKIIEVDGFIDFAEFLKLMEGEDDEESLRKTLSRLGESCTVEACKAMIRGFDQNGDGFLSFDEFLLMMR